MAVDQSMARGLVSSFRRNVISGARTHDSRLMQIPRNSRAKGRDRVIKTIIGSARGALAAKDRYAWSIWRWVEENSVSGAQVNDYLWLPGEPLKERLTVMPTILEQHMIERALQAQREFQQRTVGRYLHELIEPVLRLEHFEQHYSALAVPPALERVWLVASNGCFLIEQPNEKRRLLKTFIHRSRWDDWREKKWQSYLDSDGIILLATADQGDIVSVIGADGFENESQVLEVAKFNQERLGLETDRSWVL